MALGKNLKKVQLIPEESAVSRKAAVQPKKTESKLSAKKSASARKYKDTEKTDTNAPRGFRNVITEAVFHRRLAMQHAYDEELKTYEGQIVHLIVMKIGKELFAIEISKVREVVVSQAINELPQVPEYIKGLSEIRGAITVVMDLGVKLGFDISGIRNYIMVVENDDLDIGLLLEHVPSTLKVKGSDIHSSSGLVADAALHETFIKGIVHQPEGLVYWIDVDGLVESERAVVLKAGDMEPESRE
jgi:purine-binding chemotaxis protein CheW